MIRYGCMHGTVIPVQERRPAPGKKSKLGVEGKPQISPLQSGIPVDPYRSMYQFVHEHKERLL